MGWRNALPASHLLFSSCLRRCLVQTLQLRWAPLLQSVLFFPSLTSAFKYQFWGLFQTNLLLENNHQPPCAGTALQSSSACRQVGKTLAGMKAGGLGTFINHAFIKHLL